MPEGTTEDGSVTDTRAEDLTMSHQGSRPTRIGR